MTEREAKILQMLVQEYTESGHEVTECQGEQFARITYPNGKAIAMTDVSLTRLAAQIDQALERRGL